jgi:hypothetical protein
MTQPLTTHWLPSSQTRDGGHGEAGIIPRLTAWVRAALALFLAVALLEGANWAVRDCSTGPDASENCLWLGVRQRFGLPPSKLLRAGVLEVVGFAILAGLYLTFRYLWPRHGRPSRVDVESAGTHS